uniref:Uncharacterized protein n=1 Tax=Tetradesmus obliquus TaxID=3088 RepID=A0A383W1P4_TETOB
MKRIRGHPAEVADDALEDGALLLLAIRAGLQEQQQGSCKDPRQQQATSKSAASAAAAELSKGRHVPKAHKNSYGTRSYVWRGPHRGALALQKQQQQQQQQAECRTQTLQQDGIPAAQQQQQHYCSSASDGNSSRRSSVSGAAPSNDDEVAQQQQQQQQQEQQQVSPRQRDKEWAALTTWLRMNLHHPRTAKKLVLFVGQQDEATGVWTFRLNPGLAWGDVSLETRLRLKTLPVEAEQAFGHKYPRRPRHEWGDKLQKYRPPGASSTAAVSLRDMVTSLSRIYYQHEPSDSIAAGLGLNAAPIHSTAPQQQQQQQIQSKLAAPVQYAVPSAAADVDINAAAVAAAAAPHAVCSQEMLQRAELQLQQHLLGVHPGAQLPAAAAKFKAGPQAPAAAAHAAAPAAAAACVVGAASVLDCALLPHPQPVLISAAASVVQQQHISDVRNQSQLLPGVAAGPASAAAAAAAGDGADSCAEAVTPVSAPWTHCMAC